MDHTFRLRSLLSPSHARVFPLHGVADVCVVDPELTKRLQMIQIQVIAYSALSQLLITGDPENGRAPRSLTEAIETALERGFITYKESRVLRALNAEANRAKHDLFYRSRF